MKKENKIEHPLQDDILREFGTRSDMRIWRNNTGMARRGKYHVRFGVVGQADISGIYHDGRRIEIECKSPHKKRTDAQIAWAEMIQKFNGIYILAYSIEDVRKTFNELIRP